jgi:large subunit ribosomal protein L3
VYPNRRLIATQSGSQSKLSPYEDLKMTIGLVGRKCGMTRVFTDAGVTVPVTVVEALPNRISQVKSEKTDGYRAVQVTIGARRPSRVPKALAGHFAKANVAAGYASREFRLAKSEGESLATGAELKVDMFTVGQIVDVTGTTVGKGFAGTMKRHNFAGGMKSHGNSLSHRAPGSIGQRQTPGRVFKGKRMSGHMGVRNRTIENLRIVEVDVPRNLLLISGAVPGSEGGRVIVRPSSKAASFARRKRLAPNKAPVAAKGAPAPKGAPAAKSGAAKAEKK